eukprot:EG_transcript_28316
MLPILGVPRLGCTSPLWDNSCGGGLVALLQGLWRAFEGPVSGLPQAGVTDLNHFPKCPFPPLWPQKQPVVTADPVDHNRNPPAHSSSHGLTILSARLNF